MANIEFEDLGKEIPCPRELVELAQYIVKYQPRLAGEIIDLYLKREGLVLAVPMEEILFCTN